MNSDNKLKILAYSRFWPELLDYLDNELSSEYDITCVKSLSDDRVQTCSPDLVIADCYTNQEIEKLFPYILDRPVFTIGFRIDNSNIKKSFSRDIDLDEFIERIKYFLVKELNTHFLTDVYVPDANNYYKVLLVEDSPAILENILMSFDDENYKNFIVTATSYFDEASEIIQTQHLDIVIIDLAIPKNRYKVNPETKYGFDLIKIANNQKIPVILAMSAQSNNEFHSKSILRGADNYIDKKYLEVDQLINNITAIYMEKFEHDFKLVK